MLKIKVLGPGCPNCEKLENLCRQIVDEKNIVAEIEKISDINEFAKWNIFLTPALVVNNKILCSGKIPTKSTQEHWLIDAAN